MWQSRWTAPSQYALMADFGLGEDAQATRDVVEPFPRGPRHQLRLRAGTRVRILNALPGAGGLEPVYRVEVCDTRGRPTGWWAIVDGDDLAEASPLSIVDWLRSLRAR